MARIITGTYQATNTSSLFLEANLDHIDRYIDDRTMASVERIRIRHRNDILYNKSYSFCPSNVFKAQCWQQRSDSIQVRHKIRFQRRTRHKLTKKLTKGLVRIPSTTIRVNQAKLNIISYVPLFDYHNTVARHNTKPITLLPDSP